MTGQWQALEGKHTGCCLQRNGLEAAHHKGTGARPVNGMR